MRIGLLRRYNPSLPDYLARLGFRSAEIEFRVGDAFDPTLATEAQMDAALAEFQAREIEIAARLLGAADSVEEQIGELPQPYARRAFDEAAAAVHKRLEEPAIAAAWAAGSPGHGARASVVHTCRARA